MDLDNTSSIGEFDENFPTTSPYDIPKLQWEFIHKYFEEKYKVNVVERYPVTGVQNAAISWGIFRRIPGAGKDLVAQSRGKQPFGYIGKTDDGYLLEAHYQTFQVEYEWRVYSNTNAEADAIAWELENFLFDIIGEIQNKVPGYHQSFKEQTEDINLVFSRQDEIIVRTIRIVSVVPVCYIKRIKELDVIEVEHSIGNVGVTKRFTKADDSTSFYVPVESNQSVSDINCVFLRRNNQDILLKRWYDYKVMFNSENVAFIEWVVESGITPNIGEEFIVNYSLKIITNGNN